VEHREDREARGVDRENRDEGRDQRLALVLAVDLLLGGAGLAADEIARHAGISAGALLDDEAEQAAHLFRGLLGEHPLAARHRSRRATDQRRGPEDAAIYDSSDRVRK